MNHTIHAQRLARVVFICKGAIEVGLGHVMRSRTVAVHASRFCDVHLIVIGDNFVENLVAGLVVKTHLVQTEGEALELLRDKNPDIVFLDMLECSPAFFQAVQENERTVASLSPIFNRLADVDLVFHRTKVTNPSWAGEIPPEKIRCGLEYSVVREYCQSIPTEVYTKNAQQDPLAVAVSMGGADASNHTLHLLKALGQINRPMLLWVLLGEGYGHSYEDLVETVKRDTIHEVILAKTNSSMWRILQNCAVAVLAGGTVTYEAVYAGLPSINLFYSANHFFLVEELLEKQICVSAGFPMEAAFSVAAASLAHFEANREELIEMHHASRGVVDKLGPDRIVRETIDFHWARSAEARPRLWVA